MKLFKLLIVICLLLAASTAFAEKIIVTAAADMKFAMEEIIADFKKSHPGDEVQVIFGSSGKAYTQIQQGAPYDLFFSADIAFPQNLVKKGMAASKIRPYAIGRIVIWSTSMDAAKMTLASLTDPKITRIAIPNPKHAPYGKRAEEALRALGLWERVLPKLVYGEDMVQTAQFVQTGNAQAGIISLSFAVNPELSRRGGYYLISEKLHNPLEQAYVITTVGANKPLAKTFAEYMSTRPVRTIMVKYGFVLPGEVVKK